MAKSKNGGTRAYIRGRIGSDVYSVGKNSKGEKQQVVRSLAETVANPRSSQQMFGRMVMSTVMQAVSALKPIIDHSFDGLPTGQPSISEFIRRNYALVKADAIAHPASGNSFGLNQYQEKGIKLGAYIVSNGDVVRPTALKGHDENPFITLTAETLTIGGLKTTLGISADEYVTYVALTDTGKAVYFRLRINAQLADSTAITSENVASVFTVEGNVAVSFSLSTNTIAIEVTSEGTVSCGEWIVSKRENGAWAHSTCVLNAPTDPEYTADVALPTYPTGTEMFLNGGDL